jgi:hypothetical protein
MTIENGIHAAWSSTSDFLKVVVLVPLLMSVFCSDVIYFYRLDYCAVNQYVSDFMICLRQ